jgi:hypothetical protein
MRQVAEFVAVLTCSVFAGAALYISLVEHPARMQWGIELAATQFAPSYRHAGDSSGLGTAFSTTSRTLFLISTMGGSLPLR